MEIIVTQDHIDRGKRNDGALCPIARAIRSYAGDCYDVDVDGSSAFWIADIDDHRETFEYQLPDVARAFVRAFDRGEGVKPFQFTLRERES